MEYSHTDLTMLPDEDYKNLSLGGLYWSWGFFKEGRRKVKFKVLAIRDCMQTDGYLDEYTIEQLSGPPMYELSKELEVSQASEFVHGSKPCPLKKSKKASK